MSNSEKGVSSFQNLISKSLGKKEPVFVSEPVVDLVPKVDVKEQTISVAEFKALQRSGKAGFNGKGNKFGAKKELYNGVWYDSKKECEFAKNLDWKLKAGEIRTWFRQVPFSLDVNGVHICKYYLDFKVVNLDESILYYDVKGYKIGGAYRMFLQKKALMKAIYNIDVIEC